MDVLLIADDGTVDNCICADSVERAALFYPGHICIERTELLRHVGVGHRYDGLTFTAPPAPPPEPKILTKVEFLKRIPMLKRISIRTAAASDAVIADGMALLTSTDQVRLDDPDLQYFVGYLVTRGYLTVAESAALME